MINMKKLLIAVFVFMALMMATLVLAIMMRVDYVRYEKDMNIHLANYYDGGLVTASYDDITTQLTPVNVQHLAQALTRGSRVYVFRLPRLTGSSACISFADGAQYTIYDDESYARVSGKDRAYVIYSYNGRQSRCRIDGLATMERVLASISPDGFGAPNIVLELSEEQ